MTHAFADIAFTPDVKAAQVRDGSRAGYARAFESGEDDRSHHLLGPRESAFIASQRSMVMATVSSTGWPYVQHRGGPAGFIHVLDPSRIAFADLGGNRQFISVGNLAGNDRVSLLLVDYATRQRLKLMGRAKVTPLESGSALFDRLARDAAAPVSRAMVIEVAAFDWNCPQHIPVRFEAEDVEQAIRERDTEIAELRALLAEARQAATRG